MKSHLKRIATPRSWKIKRKGITFITRPFPGAHSFEFGMPIVSILRDILGVVKTTREVKNILQNKEVLINKKPIKEVKYLVGLMDVLSIPKIQKNYRMLVNNKGRIVLISISEEESSIKLSKITGKKVIKNGKTQINLLDSRNFVVDSPKAKEYGIKDTVVFEIPKNTIKTVLKFDKDCFVLLIGGKHIGNVGIIDSIAKDSVIFKSQNGESFETKKEYCFVIGKDKPLIGIEE